MTSLNEKASALKIKIFVTTSFAGFHCWPEAPPEHEYLRHRHRHLFQVRAEKEVSHADRDIEFIELKACVDAAIEQQRGEPETATWSCETWATYLLQCFGLSKCEVNEDGENGAIVEVDSIPDWALSRRDRNR
ncbi:MAG: hypothetical protein ABIP75_03120 [Pyrinomonadaceae bacterium]